MEATRSVGRQLIVVAALYLVTSLALGFAMAVTGNHALFSVHSHLALLGWATMGLTGVVYLVLPGCGASVLARVHFWLHNLGLPIMMAALAALTVTGNAGLQPAIGLGSLLVVAGLLAFTINVIRNGANGAPRERPVAGVGA